MQTLTSQRPLNMSTKILFFLYTLCVLTCVPMLSWAATTEFIYAYQGNTYPYTIAESGENYTFEFSRNPGQENEQLQASLHVFQSVYDDDTIAPQYSEFFMKESARCFAFDARFYTYRVCIIPNDYSPDKTERFWGFINRLPNLWWFITYNFLPVGLAGMIYYMLRKKRLIADSNV